MFKNRLLLFTISILLVAFFFEGTGYSMSYISGDQADQLIDVDPADDDSSADGIDVDPSSKSFPDDEFSDDVGEDSDDSVSGKTEISNDLLDEDDDLDVEPSSSEVGKEIEGDDGIFMGDEDDEEEYYETPEYLASRKNLFISPMERLGTKPLRLTLEDCVRIALLNNNKIQATTFGINSSEAQLEEARARFYPVFEYEWLNAPVPKNVNNAVGQFFAGNVTWWNKIKIAMGIPLYSFGKLSTAQDLARGGIVAAKERRKKERISTVTQVRQLYYGVLLAEELGRLLVKAHKALSKGMNEDEKDGKSPIDKIKAKVFLLDIEKRLAETRDKETLALEGLRVQLGLNPDVAVAVYSTKLRPLRADIKSLDDYLKMALVNRPDMKLVEVGLETRRKQFILEKKKWFPDIGFGAYLELGRTIHDVANVTATDNFTDPFNFSRAGIGMQVKGRFDVHGQVARTNKAESEYYKASLEHYMAKDGIMLDLKKAYIDAKRSLDDVRRTDMAQKYARQFMFLSESNYELGIDEKDEYIESLKLVLFTRGKYFESIFNYNVALAVLDEKAGIVSHADRVYRWTEDKVLKPVD